MNRLAPIVSALGLAAGLVLAFTSPALAQRRPPREALDACTDREDGDDCSVRLRGQTIAGTCMALPDGPLTCVLDRGGAPPPAHGGGSPSAGRCTDPDDDACDAW